jgi:hypothetical protein
MIGLATNSQAQAPNVSVFHQADAGTNTFYNVLLFLKYLGLHNFWILFAGKSIKREQRTKGQIEVLLPWASL